MKKIVISLALLTLSTMSNGMKTLVTLPDSETIKERLEALKVLDDFVRVTKIHNKLGGKELYPIGVYFATSNAFDVFREHLCPKLADIMDEFAPIVITTILQDHPKALEELIEFREKGES